MPTAQMDPGRARTDLVDDVLGRAGVVGRLHDIPGDFGMHDHAHARMLGADLLDLTDREPGVHGAMPLPEDDARAPGRLGVDAAPGFVGIPQHHLVERHAHLVGGVPAQMLIGEEEHTPPALPGPAQRRRRVRRGADDTAVLAAEGFDARGRIDVRDRNDRCLATRLRRVGRPLDPPGLSMTPICWRSDQHIRS